MESQIGLYTGVFNLLIEHYPTMDYKLIGNKFIEILNVLSQPSEKDNSVSILQKKVIAIIREYEKENDAKVIACHSDTEIFKLMAIMPLKSAHIDSIFTSG